MTRPLITFIGATALSTLMASCDSLHKVSGKYEEENNPGTTIVLVDDGTCTRDKASCTYVAQSKAIKITMDLDGTVLNGTIDGKRIMLTEPNPSGGIQTAVFVRK